MRSRTRHDEKSGHFRDPYVRSSGFRRAEHPYISFPHGFSKLELAVDGPCHVTLEIECIRPSESSLNGVQCIVSLFRAKRHERDVNLEDHVFIPNPSGNDGITWRDRGGCNYSPAQICDFAFHRFNESIEQCYRRCVA
jgi:hypothetical protein